MNINKLQDKIFKFTSDRDWEQFANEDDVRTIRLARVAEEREARHEGLAQCGSARFSTKKS